MAFGSSVYTDPNAYTQEVIVPSGINIPALPFAPCLIGVGSRNKTVSNEAVIRGVVKGEALSPAGSSPHIVALTNRALRRQDTTKVYRTLNGIKTTLLSQFVSFDPAYVLGSITSTVDLSTATALDAFALEMDGVTAVTMVLHPTLTYAAGQNVTFGSIVGSAVTITRPAATFLTDGVRPGATLTLALAEDSANNGTYTVVSVTSETVVSVTKDVGVPVPISASPDTAVTIATSGVGALGREMHVFDSFSGTGGNAALMSEIAAAVNLGLSSTVGTSLGFGSAYASAASTFAGALKISSQLVNGDGSGTSASDVQVFSAIAHDGSSAIFGAPGPSNRSAKTYLHISDLIWNSSATWSADYVELTGALDPLAQTSDIQNVVNIGSSPGATDFTQFSDWTLSGEEISWAANTAASATGISGTAGSAPDKTFDLSTNDQLVLEFDGEVSVFGSIDITIDLVGMVDPPLNYLANPGGTGGNASTVANIVRNINSVVASALGPRYDSVASLVVVNGSNRILLTSPTLGQFASSVAVKAAPSNSAHTVLFGGVVFPPSLGTGKKPAPGTTYFVSYQYTRPDSEYGVPFRSFSVEDALAQVGQPSAVTAGYNPLGIASQISFENGAQFIYTVQVDDVSEGNPSRSQIKDGLDGAGTIAGTTEIVVVGEPGTRLDVTTDMVNHLETQCSPIEKHPRRVWCGSASGTPIGDKDTVSSIVGKATRTLQVSASSPGRGRMFNVAPPQQSGVSRDVGLDDGSTARLQLDATYLGAALAARRCSLLGPAETLTRKTITGFNTDDISAPWKPAERRTMAGQGTLVVTYDAGRFIMLDALSTEGGGGGLVAFQVDSTSYQKDVVVTKVNQALDDNIVGIVPFDLATFILDIKLVIQGVIAGEISKGTIGPFRDPTTGASRPIDLRTDIRVSQDVNDPTAFLFSFFYMLRYPCLRLFGTYSVDNFFLSTGS